MKLRSSRCCICHTEANNQHHEPPKGEVGDHDDTITLCGFGNADKCHGLAHHNGGSVTILKPTSEGEPWHFVPGDKEAARQITKRRKAHGLPPVKVGFQYRVVPIEDCEGLDEAPPSAGVTPDPIADILAVATETFRDLDSSTAKKMRQRAVLLHRVRSEVGNRVYQKWVIEDCGMSKALASKSTTVVDYLGEELGIELPFDTCYQAARAVKLGKLSAEEAIAELQVSTLHDFVEAHGLVKPRDKREKLLACPDCGASRPVSEYEIVEEE